MNDNVAGSTSFGSMILAAPDPQLHARCQQKGYHISMPKTPSPIDHASEPHHPSHNADRQAQHAPRALPRRHIRQIHQ